MPTEEEDREMLQYDDILNEIKAKKQLKLTAY
jgi:hypothetical protein